MICLLFVQLQAITGHPVTDPRDALRQTIRRIRMVCGCRGGATDIKMVRQNRGAAGAQASAEGTTMEAP